MQTGICIIGAGPAGLMAAIHAAASAPTVVMEGKAAAGRKLLLTGGGRCNFTHAGDPEEIARAFGKTGRFLRPSLYEFSPEDVREFFRARGLASTVEPDGCVFPVSNQAADILDILVREAEGLGARLLYRSRVTDLATSGGSFVVRTEDREVRATRLIIATGGLSWPQTGSRGDGYRFAAQLGHTVIPPKPALVPLRTRETWPGTLAGVSLAGVQLRATVGGRKLTVTGNLLFTQNGIGGPAVLDLSRLLADELPANRDNIGIAIDVLPARDAAQLDRQLQKQCKTDPKKATANILSEHVPRQFARLLCRLAECSDDAPAGQLTAERRRRLVGLLKRLPLSITGTEPITRATVTHGGVRRDEIHSRTMESRIRPRLFFAGEVIDLDGPCGGYNLHMCWSTGARAGRSAAHSFLRTHPPT
jgi:predicted Rossmann fold flavoprotein